MYSRQALSLLVHTSCVLFSCILSLYTTWCTIVCVYTKLYLVFCVPSCIHVAEIACTKTYVIELVHTTIHTMYTTLCVNLVCYTIDTQIVHYTYIVCIAWSPWGTQKPQLTGSSSPKADKSQGDGLTGFSVLSDCCSEYTTWS